MRNCASALCHPFIGFLKHAVLLYDSYIKEYAHENGNDGEKHEGHRSHIIHETQAFIGNQSDMEACPA